jgi:hypothetical protein
MNVNIFAQTPGTEETVSGIFSQRSGLEKKNGLDNLLKTKLREPT